MKRALWASVTACAFALAAPANAVTYVFDSTNDAVTVDFNGFANSSSDVISGLTSRLTLTLVSGAGTRDFRFSYVLTNTSTAAFNGSRVSGFAFNVNPDVDGGTIINLGDFSNILASGGSYPNGIGGVEVCLKGSNGNNCSGGGNAGATIGDPATGEFTLSFADAPMNGVTLDRFFVRYQGLPPRDGSASGQAVTTAVPEPGAWMMLLAGFFAVGFALRRRPRSASAPMLASC